MKKYIFLKEEKLDIREIVSLKKKKVLFPNEYGSHAAKQLQFLFTVLSKMKIARSCP